MLLTCTQCGVRFESPIITGTASLRLQDVRTNCPNGHVFTIPDGDYDMVDSVVTAFRGATAAQIAELKAVAELARAERISPAEAINQAANISAPFAGLMGRLQAVGGLPLLIAMIALLLQIMSANSDDAADAAQLAELKAIAGSNAEIAAILSETAGSPEPPRRAAPTTPSTHTKTSAPHDANRHERRRLKAEERRKSKPLP